MIFFVNGIEINPQHISYPPMNFGQILNDKKYISYTIEIPINEFIDNFHDDYIDLVEELIEDDKITGDTPFPFAEGYPKLNEIGTLDTDQLTIWIEFLRVDIFDYYFKQDKLECISYIIVTWDKVEIINDNLIINGLAFNRSF